MATYVVSVKDGEGEIHKVGCADLTRAKSVGREQWTISGDNPEDAAMNETLANFCGEVEPQDWESWLRIMPCAKEV